MGLSTEQCWVLLTLCSSPHDSPGSSQRSSLLTMSFVYLPDGMRGKGHRWDEQREGLGRALTPCCRGTKC